MDIDQVSDYLWLLMGIKRYGKGALAFIEPVCDEMVSLESQHEDVDVVVSSEEVLMGVDEVIGQFVTELVHAID